MSFENQVYCGVKERMAGQMNSATGLPATLIKSFSKRRSYRSEDGVTHADDPIPVANHGGDMGRLVTLRFSFRSVPPSRLKDSLKNAASAAGDAGPRPAPCLPE